MPSATGRGGPAHAPRAAPAPRAPPPPPPPGAPPPRAPRLSSLQAHSGAMIERLDEAVAMSVRGGLRAVSGARLVEDVRDVRATVFRLIDRRPAARLKHGLQGHNGCYVRRQPYAVTLVTPAARRRGRAAGGGRGGGGRRRPPRRGASSPATGRGQRRPASGC